jgi:hypothetical protein
MKIINLILLIQILIGGAFCDSPNAQTELSDKTLPETVLRFQIKPSETDQKIKAADTPHLVIYNPDIKQGKLLLFMPGTNGIAVKGPEDFFLTAIQQGYRVINLSYINIPAGSQVCKNENYGDCAENFRNKRIYGENTFSLIPDEPQDAIMNRFTKLLNYLVEYDKQGNWEMYLENGAPKWDQIALSGQSQGGGMAAFIAKKVIVAKVIAFSGGWDFSAKNVIANWYYSKSATPPELWYGTYHVNENMAKTIDETYRAMAIPDNHIYPLDLEVPEGMEAHPSGVKNPAYKHIWIEMLGMGN